MHRGTFCQFPFRWIYYYGSNKSTGKETDKTHLCALYENRKTPPSGYYVLNIISYFALFRAKTKFCTIYYVLVTKKAI